MYDIIGDIAIVEEDTKENRNLVNEFKNINVVLAKQSDVEGEFRVRDYEVIASKKERDFDSVPKKYRPEKLTETIHKESGCRFKVDPTRAYFSVRLSTERERIFKQVKDGENILVMFAGIGPYPITIAKHKDVEKIYAIELNPEAFKLMTENIILNKTSNIMPILGDAGKEALKIEGRFDRIIMPLPKESELFLDVALRKIRPGGTIHMYKILHENDVDSFVKKLKTQNLKLQTVKAGDYSPGSFRYCFDITR